MPTMVAIVLLGLQVCSAFVVAPTAMQRTPTISRAAASEISMGQVGAPSFPAPPPGTHATIIFLRHGQSNWNEANRFTGWADVPLTTLGKNEAAGAATAMWEAGLNVDVAFCSLLTRAQQTLAIALKIMGQEDVPINYSWRLNERMYGGLTGLNKKETVAKYGDDQVKKWRRSYAIPPPPIEKDSPYWPGNDAKYAHIPEDEIPLSECLKDTVDRCLPYWERSIMPALKRGNTVLVAAHGNSIRGMLKYLDNISDSAITELEIPTGVPLVYRLDKDLKVMPSPLAVAPLTGHFLVDEAELKRKQEEVANQSKLRYGEIPEPVGAK
jgi:2,3-bisphosphoglycerate-dependent phosphoglycerate mutase